MHGLLLHHHHHHHVSSHYSADVANGSMQQCALFNDAPWPHAAHGTRDKTAEMTTRQGSCWLMQNKGRLINTADGFFFLGDPLYLAGLSLATQKKIARYST